MVHAPNVPMEFYEWQAWILTTLQLSPFEPPMLCLNKTHLEYFKICWKMKVTFMAFHHGSGIYKHWIHWRLEGDSWFVSQLGPAIEQGKSMHNIWYTNMFFSIIFFNHIYVGLPFFEICYTSMTIVTAPVIITSGPFWPELQPGTCSSRFAFRKPWAAKPSRSNPNAVSWWRSISSGKGAPISLHTRGMTNQYFLKYS